VAPRTRGGGLGNWARWWKGRVSKHSAPATWCRLAIDGRTSMCMASGLSIKSVLDRFCVCFQKYFSCQCTPTMGFIYLLSRSLAIFVAKCLFTIFWSPSIFRLGVCPGPFQKCVHPILKTDFDEDDQIFDDRFLIRKTNFFPSFWIRKADSFVTDFWWRRSIFEIDFW